MMVRQLALVFLGFDGGDYGMDCVVVVDVCILGATLIRTLLWFGALVSMLARVVVYIVIWIGYANE